MSVRNLKLGCNFLFEIFKIANKISNRLKAVSYKLELEFQINTKFAQNSPSQFGNTRDSYDYFQGYDQPRGNI